MLKLISFLFLLVSSFPTVGQDIAVGSWRNHADYSTALKVTVFDDKVFCTTANGLFYYDREDGSLNPLNTTNGLSSINISMVKAINDKLLIAFEDGVLNVLDENLNIVEFSDIFQSDLLGSKTINDAIELNGVIYLATDFGVVLFNPEENELIDAFINLSQNGERLSIKSISTANNKLYLSSEEGLLLGDLSSNLNLKDFQNWLRYPIGSNLTELTKTTHFNNRIFGLAANDSIYEFLDSNWLFLFSNQTPIHQFKRTGNTLYFSSQKTIYEFKDDTFEESFTVAESSKINDFSFLENQFYLADESESLVKYQSGSVEKLQPQGPKGILKSLIQIEQFTFHLTEMKGGFSFFENGRWAYTGKDTEAVNLPSFNDVALDLISGNGIFISSEEGLYSWDTEKIEKLPDTDPSISEWISLAEDPDGSYWALVKTTSNFYAIFNPQNDLLVETDLPANRNIRDYVIAPNRDHYFATSTGVFIFNPESQESRLLNSVLGNGNLPANSINDLAIDLEGQLWIATSNGVAFFNNYQAALEGSNVDASKPVFEGFFLFDGIPVNHITIDGGNRKWMSTRDGLWQFDENIERNLLHLRRVNSPIVNNNIQEMVVNPLNGELFLASNDQFLSYKTDATRAGAFHTEVEVFPNPVRLSADNIVTIRGLAYNNEVMITDVSGNLIHKGEANGGTFSWDLGNYSGFRARAGVYLVFSINADGSETYQAKFAVIP